MLPSFARDTVTILRASKRTDRGTDALDWSDPTSLLVSGCSVQPSGGSRDFERDANTDVRWTAYVPPSTDVHVGDRIVWNGSTYEIDGEPRVWSSPTGAVSHVQLDLVRWEG